MFISDLEHVLRSTSSGKIKTGQQEVTSIMFTDDLILLADTSEGLQQSLSVVQECCKEWQLKMNAEKSEVMICSKAPLSSQYIYGKEFEIVSSLKYLGLVLESNGSLKSAIKQEELSLY